MELVNLEQLLLLKRREDRRLPNYVRVYVCSQSYEDFINLMSKLDTIQLYDRGIILVQVNILCLHGLLLPNNIVVAVCIAITCAWMSGYSVGYRLNP